MFPLAPGFEVKNKLKYQPLNWRKGIKLAIQRLGEGKFCSSFTKYYFPNTFKQYFNNQTALKNVNLHVSKTTLSSSVARHPPSAQIQL